MVFAHPLPTLPLKGREFFGNEEKLSVNADARKEEKRRTRYFGLTPEFRSIACLFDKVL